MTSTERMRLLVQRRKAQGICPKCKSPEPDHKCRREKLRRALWRAQGRCSANGCPLPEGYTFKVCEEHRERARRRRQP